MDGFIPPPFPFPEAWPRVFAEQQVRQERRWLTPTTFAPVQPPIAGEYYNNYPVGQSISVEAPIATVKDENDEVEEEEGEYEYGYVLSDEWRERFRSSVQVQPQPKKGKKKKKQQKKKSKRQAVNSGAVAAASASRSGHLQREVQAAKTRELARKWKRRGTSDTAASTDAQTVALETSLNMLFDEFCDAFQPVVWPHDPLHR